MNRFTVPDDECASLAPFLTELFDGEADAESAARARSHLLSCQKCARLWLDWNQHRDILRNESVPAPPPTLLWRVLLACRVASAERPRKRAPELSLHHLEAPLPANLSAHILARTTRRPVAAHCAPVMLTPTDSIERRAARFRQWPRWSVMAAPALAALFLLSVTRADFEPTPMARAPFEAAQNTASAASPAERLSAPAITKTVRASHASPVAPVAAPGRAVSLLATRPAPALAETSAEGAPDAEAVPSPVRRLRATAAIIDAARPLATNVARPAPVAAAPGRRAGANLNQVLVVAFDTIGQESEAMPAASAPVRTERDASAALVEFEPRHRVSVATTPRARRASLRLAALPASPRVVTSATARLRPASFSEQPNAPHSRVALSNSSPARALPDESNQNLRVSRPAPLMPGVRLASLSNENSNLRLEDLHSAVDDFRASISDNPLSLGWEG